MDKMMYVNFNNEIITLILHQPKEDARSIYDQLRVYIQGPNRRLVYNFYSDMMKTVRLPHLRNTTEFLDDGETMSVANDDLLWDAIQKYYVVKSEMNFTSQDTFKLLSYKLH